MLRQFFNRDDDPRVDPKRLLALLEASRALNSERTFKPLLDFIVDRAVDLLGAERGFVVVDRDGKLDVPSARNVDREDVRKALEKISSSIVNQVLRSGVAIVADDAAADSAFSSSRSVMDLRLRSVLCVPLKTRNKTIGALCLDNRFARGRFTEADREFLEAYAAHAAIAIENARLHEENAQVRARLEELNKQLEDKAARALAELERIQREAVVARPDPLEGRYESIVGRGPQMMEVLKLVDRVKDGDYPVLIRGESGTGKELIARAIHDNGPRRAKPFVAVNCSSINESLLESELFGVKRGAFTGAHEDRKGLIEVAAGGTLFLDEVAEMSLALQSKLLRFLQDHKVRRVGGTEEILMNVRIISATHRPLEDMIIKNLFRQDLFFRLRVVEIRVPSLREHRANIPELVATFLQKECKRIGAEKNISNEAMAKLMARDWPGNVRELENEVTRLFALSGDTITPDLVEMKRSATVAMPIDEAVHALVGRRLEEIESALIRATLQKTGGNKTEAARILAIPRRTFYSRLATLGIDGQAPPEAEPQNR
ncbi:MAG: sigma-54-dependent Fis family transcriptional regulator [Planctomycetes bacterium]|nr:sigma-54-dependent Fis family transcriptional regulator [Planctomycetota bacterium]